MDLVYLVMAVILHKWKMFYATMFTALQGYTASEITLPNEMSFVMNHAQIVGLTVRLLTCSPAQDHYAMATPSILSE